MHYFGKYFSQENAWKSWKVNFTLTEMWGPVSGFHILPTPLTLQMSPFMYNRSAPFHTDQFWSDWTEKGPYFFHVSFEKKNFLFPVWIIFEVHCCPSLIYDFSTCVYSHIVYISVAKLINEIDQPTSFISFYLMGFSAFPFKHRIAFFLF